MTFAELISKINEFIITNGNNEITAAILNPILKDIAQWAKDTTGDLSDLTTDTQENLVAAINELNDAIENINNGGVQIYQGTDDPNVTPPPIFSTGDFYLQVDGSNNPIQLYQYNGFDWIIPSDQDNIDITIGVTVTANEQGGVTTEQIAAAINNLPEFTINEKQSLWVDVRHAGTNPLLTSKYKIMNLGKGVYGNSPDLGAISVAATDVKLITPPAPATVQDFEGPDTDTINFDPLTDPDIVSDWLNEQSVAIDIQPQNEGYTLFKGTVDGNEVSYLWIGEPGLYGASEEQSTMADFELLSDTVESNFVPYEGATQDVDLGTKNIKAGSLRMFSGGDEYWQMNSGGGDLILYTSPNDKSFYFDSSAIDEEAPIIGLRPDSGTIAYTSDLTLKADLVAGKVPAAQLPSYVDDILEYADLSSFPVTGEDGKLYVALDTNLVYRWSGSTYVEISPSVVPTLDAVTSAGNTTTNDVNVNSIGLADQVDGEGAHRLTAGEKRFTFKKDGGTSDYFSIEPTNIVRYNADGSTQYTYYFPGVDGTLALEENQTLQSTTDNGNTTTNDINVNNLGIYDSINDTHNIMWSVDTGLAFGDGLEHNADYFVAQPDALSFGRHSTSKRVTIDNQLLTASRQYKMQDKNGTIALKENTPQLIHSTAVDSTVVSGTTSEVLVAAFKIDANRIGQGILDVALQMSKTGTGGTIMFRLYKNTTNTKNGSEVQLGTVAVGATQLYFPFSRKFQIKADGEIYGYPAAVGAATDAGVTLAPSHTPFDTTIDEYFLLTMQPTSALDTGYVRGFETIFKAQQ